ncbi:MAG: L-threonylcarbamoyladenylate synthase [Bacillota bacterium]|nr:L-threonylcarbamoyladenylate synthase [Bacillota bacterium]
MSADYKTCVICVDAQMPDDRLLLPAGLALRRGELVAFPTLNPDAVARIFQVKGRPPDNPLIVHSADISGLEPLVGTLTPLARSLLLHFSPGPLTLVLPRSRRVPTIVTAGLDTVAVRIPDHPVALSLLRLAGIPVAAPSANRSGRPSPTRARHVLEDFDGRIPFLIDGGTCRYGLESTVVDITGDKPVILRPGSITAADILKATGIEPVAAANAYSNGDLQGVPIGRPRSPGMKYRHYAPKARVIIAEESQGDCVGCIMTQLVQDWLSRDARVGVYACEKAISRLGLICRPLSDFMDAGISAGRPAQVPPATCCSLSYGPDPDSAMAGRTLFDALRTFDAISCDVIIVEGLPDHGVGTAYMNRLRKAAQADSANIDPDEEQNT